MRTSERAGDIFIQQHGPQAHPMSELLEHSLRSARALREVLLFGHVRPTAFFSTSREHFGGSLFQNQKNKSLRLAA